MEDALFSVTSDEAVITTSYDPVQTLSCCYLYAIKINSKILGAYNFSTHQTTSSLQECVFVRAYQGMTYELPSR